MTTGQFGTWALWTTLLASVFTMGAYAVALLRPSMETRLRKVARSGYAVAAAGILSAFASLCVIVYNNKYQYDYAFSHTGNDLRALPTDTFSHWLFHHWIRLAATWSGQEGSFLLWAFWTALIGFLVFRQSGQIRGPRDAVLRLRADVPVRHSHQAVAVPLSGAGASRQAGTTIPPDGQGLTPSLQNYWMTIHPPTIFFGFASLAVPYAYAARRPDLERL